MFRVQSGRELRDVQIRLRPSASARNDTYRRMTRRCRFHDTANHPRDTMRRILLIPVISVLACTHPRLQAQQAGTDGPYKVLKRAQGRRRRRLRLHLRRRRRPPPLHPARRHARRAGDGHHAGRCRRFPAASPSSISRRSRRVGEIPGTGGNGVAVDPKSGHGFSSSKPVSMFDTKTLKLIKTIDVGAGARAGRHSASTRSTIASTSSATRRRTRRSSTRRTARCSARSISAACPSRPSPTARARSTS